MIDKFKKKPKEREKKNVALVTGGYSKESEISYKSAENIKQNFDYSTYNLFVVCITRERWYHVLSNGETIDIQKEDFSISTPDFKILFDVIFLCIHGTPGEDGILQGYFDILQIPYTSCGCSTSAVTFNKGYTNGIAAFSGIPVAKSIRVFKNSPLSEVEILSHVKFPFFVKPNNGGSSIGISKVTGFNNFSQSLEKAFKEDEEILIEEFIEGREFTIGLFKNKSEIITLPITEIISENEFFDFAAKYHGQSKEITPAEIDIATSIKLKSTAIKIYHLFNCRGIVRIDLIFNEKTSQPYLLEINTVPGQSAQSIVPGQVKAMGWELKTFYSTLLENAMNISQ